MNVSAADLPARAAPRAHDWLLLGVLAAIFALAGIFGSRGTIDSDVFWKSERAELVEDDRPELSDPSVETAGRDVAVADIGDLDEVVWLRIPVDLQADASPEPPVALYLSGPFSADVYWDGQALGNKGRAGVTKALEIPGPIDATFYVPEGWSDPGQHFLALRLSAFHVGYTPEQIIHSLALGGFRSDPRRELRYYAWPLLLSGGFLLIGMLFLRMYLDSAAPRALWSAAMAGFLLLQLAAEIGRSLIAYDYQWHLYRSLAIWLAAFAWGVSWQLAAWSRTRERSHRLVIAATVAIALVVSFFAPGFDIKAAGAIGVLALMPLAVALHQVARARSDVILLGDAVLAVALIATAALSPGGLLDRVFYMLLAAHLCATWFLMYTGNQQVDAPVAKPSTEEFFSVKLAGRQIRVPIAEVAYLRAEGNYCELKCRDGKTHLHQDRLGQIMESPPAGFVRVQRSYAINTNYLESLRSLEGSRYRVVLSTGDEVPVSRYRVEELRKFMGAH